MSLQMECFLSFMYVGNYKDLEFIILKREGFNLLSLKWYCKASILAFQLTNKALFFSLHGTQGTTPCLRPL